MQKHIDAWIQIPCAPKYEINRLGDVRNIKSGRLLKASFPKGRGTTPKFSLYVGKGGKTRNFYQTALLWLTHGFIPKRKNHSRIVVPVIVSYGKNESYYFGSLRQASKFLSTRLPFTKESIHSWLTKTHTKEYHGWRINYQR